MTNAFKRASKLLILAVIAVSSQASATSVWMKVTHIRTYEDGSTVVHVDVNNLATSCSTKDAFRIGRFIEGSDSMQKLALSAFLAGKEIRVGLTSACTSNYDNVDWVQIR